MKRFTKDLGFAEIFRNKRIDNKLVNIFKKSFLLNKKLFKRAPKKFKIIICDNEKEFKKKSGYYYQKWATATVRRNRNIITRSPDFIEKIGRWKRKDFQKLMNHEMNHVFYKSFYHIIKPIWLVEGLACHVGNNFTLPKNELKKLIEKYDVKYSILEHRYMKRKFKKGHYPRYPIWANFTRYIINKYSIHRLIKLMDEYSKQPVKQYYNKMFKSIFEKREKELFNEFLRFIGI